MSVDKLSYMSTACIYVFFTNQDNFTDGNARWYIKNPVYWFVANEHKYNRSVGFSTTDDIDPRFSSIWRTSINSLVHRQYVNLVQR
jgi:hypothetical protein